MPGSREEDFQRNKAFSLYDIWPHLSTRTPAPGVMKFTILVYPSLEISNTIISNLDKGKYVRFIFCDISNPFDKVWHKGFLFKLESYGLDDNTLIENYLNDRVRSTVKACNKEAGPNFYEKLYL